MNRKVFSLGIGVVLASTLAGCSWLMPAPNYVVQRNFDFGTPETSHPFPVEVQQFNSDSSARYRMQFRYGNELRVHESERWIQPPASMLTRYLRLYFSDKNAGGNFESPKFRLSGSILVFEADPEKRIATMAFRYTVSSAKDNKVLCSGVIEEKIPFADSDGKSGNDFSAAMSKAAASAAKKLSVVLQNADSVSRQK